MDYLVDHRKIAKTIFLFSRRSAMIQLILSTKISARKNEH
jgi:hypothetical protein